MGCRPNGSSRTGNSHKSAKTTVTDDLTNILSSATFHSSDRTHRVDAQGSVRTASQVSEPTQSLYIPHERSVWLAEVSPHRGQERNAHTARVAPTSGRVLCRRVWGASPTNVCMPPLRSLITPRRVAPTPLLPCLTRWLSGERATRASRVAVGNPRVAVVSLNPHRRCRSSPVDKCRGP